MALTDIYSPRQIEVMKWAQTHGFFILINHGAKRSGKTVLDNDLFLAELKRVSKMAAREGIAHPQYILAGADLGSIQRNVLIELTNKYGISVKFDKHNRFELFGVKVCCFGHSKITDLSHIRGMTAAGAYINEAVLANRRVFAEILSRCSLPGARIIMDTNPDRPSHWLKTDYIDKADGKTIQAFRWRLTDNTFLPQTYIDSIKASTPSGAFYSRDIDGAWVAAAGICFPDFVPERHYIKRREVPWDRITRTWAGVDFGWEHYGVIVLLGEDDAGTKYLLKEWAAKHRSMAEWIHIARTIQAEHGEDIIFYCDSARPDRIKELQEAGIWAINARKDVTAGISYVDSLYKTDRLFVCRDGVDLFSREIDTYSWQEGKDEPVKEADDCMDAVRYGLYSDYLADGEATYNKIKGGI